MYQFKIQLLQGNNSVWRRILVSEDTSFRELHEIISIVMDWDVFQSFDFFFQDIYYYIEGKNLDFNPNFGLFSDDEELFRVLEPISLYEDHLSSCIYTHKSKELWKMELSLEAKTAEKTNVQVTEFYGENIPSSMDVEAYMEMSEALQDPFCSEAASIRKYLADRGVQFFDIENCNKKLNSR